MLPLAFALSAHAASLAGVTLPDTATVGGSNVTLNGLGLREKYLLDIYVGGLYLATPTRDGAAAIASDTPKRIVLHYLYPRITRQQMVDVFMEGFGDAAKGPHKAGIDAMIAVVPAEVRAGDEMVFDYAPGVGTTMRLGGKGVVTVPGADFMRLVWGMFLGPRPPTEALKAGMLGGG